MLKNENVRDSTVKKLKNPNAFLLRWLHLLIFVCFIAKKFFDHILHPDGWNPWSGFSENRDNVIYVVSFGLNTKKQVYCWKKRKNYKK